MLGVKASTSSRGNEKEMKSYMDQMNEELAQTSIGESFGKVNMFLISSIAVLLSCGRVKLTTTADPYGGKLCNKPIKTRGKNV